MTKRKSSKEQPAIIVGACRFRTEEAAQIARDNRAKFAAAMDKPTPGAKAEAFATFFNLKG